MRRVVFVLVVIFSFYSCKRDYTVPKDFNFSFRFAPFNDHKINTFDSTYKTVAGYHDTVVKLVFTMEDKIKLYDTLIKYDYMSLPDTITNIYARQSQFEGDTLIIQANSKRKIIYFEGSPSEFKGFDKPIHNRFYSIRNTILYILFSKKEVKSLPKTRRLAE